MASANFPPPSDSPTNRATLPNDGSRRGPPPSYSGATGNVQRTPASTHIMSSHTSRPLHSQPVPYAEARAADPSLHPPQPGDPAWHLFGAPGTRRTDVGLRPDEFQVYDDMQHHLHTSGVPIPETKGKLHGLLKGVLKLVGPQHGWPSHFRSTVLPRIERLADFEHVSRTQRVYQSVSQAVSNNFAQPGLFEHPG